MSVELMKAVYALIGAVIGFLLTSILKWYFDKRERKRIKTAEYFSSLSKYVDYLITLTFYPKTHIENNYTQILIHLELLKSQLIESQCLLIAFNNRGYFKTKSVVSQAIEIDTEFTSIIFIKKYQEGQLENLNTKAFALIKKIQSIIEDSKLDN